MKFGAFLFVFLLFAAAKGDFDPKPFVVSQTGCKDKGLCETIVIENPLMKPVLVDITCGPEFDRSEVQVPARTRLSIDIETTSADKNLVCKMASWKVVQ